MVLRHFNKILIILFGAILTFISFLLIIAYRQNQITEDTFYKVNNYHNVVDEASHLLSLTNKIQLESNGYVITGDSNFLKEYQLTKNEVPTRLLDLEQRLQKKSKQLQDIDSLRFYLNKLIIASDKYIQLKQHKHFNKEHFLKKIIEGSQNRASAVNFTTAIIESCTSKLQNIRAANKNAYELLDKVFTILVMAILLYLLMALFLIRYVFKRQQLIKAKIRENEKQFQAFFNLSPVATSITDAHTGRFLYINEAYEELIGYKKNETFSKSVVELNIISKTTRDQTVKSIAANDGKLRHVEMQFLARNGTTKEVYASFDTLEIDNRKCFLGCMIDITERKQSEERLRKSEERFAIITNMSPVPTFISEVETGKYLVINNSFATLLGMRPEEIIGKTSLELKIIDKATRYYIALKVESNKGKINNLEIRMTIKNEPRNVLFSTEEITLDDRKCYLSTIFDISERKAAEIKLKQSEEKFAVITQLNPIPTFIIHEETEKIIYVNDAFGDLMKKNVREIVGNDLVELNLFNEEYYQLIKNIIKKKDGKLKNQEIKMNVKNEIKDFLLSCQEIYIDNEKCSIGTILDISERKKTEETLKEAYLKERELSSMKSNFVSIASHEFRTPLTTILSSAALLEMYKTTEQQDDRMRHIERIKNASANLTMILEEMLSLERIETNRIEPKITTFDIEEFTENLCRELRYATKKNQALVYRHTGGKEVQTDHSIIRHILTNLISNGMKYSPENTEVQITTSYNGERLVIKVCDSGIGISENDQKFLFKRFYRASNAGNVQGTGLGLHIVKRYVDMLDGSISVKSELGKGSEFTVEFTI